MKEVVFDLEGNGLTPDKIHVFSYEDGDRITSTSEYCEISSFLSSNPILVGHNVMRFDVPVLEDILGVRIDREQVIDTLFLSWYCFPTRGKHGLEEWGEYFGYPKVPIDDWDNLTYEEYKARCERDVEINILLWKKIKAKLLAIYGTKEKLLRCINYLMFKARCAALAEKNKWRIDIHKTLQNISTLSEEREEKRKLITAAMPDVPVYSKMTRPKKERKLDNTLTKVGEKWYTECEKQNLDPENTDEISILRSYKEPNPNSSDQVKNWLFDLGWQPDEFKTNDKGIEVPQINTQDPSKKGELTSSVLALKEKAPEAILALQGLSTLNHRIPILEGFLKNVDEEGYITASIGGLTNTLRFKHTKVVNLPSVHAPYGDYLRPCLVAGPNTVLLGSDMSSLEDRTKQHFMYPHDPEYVHSMLQEDFDPHLDLAVLADMMTEQDAEDYKNKKNREALTPIRYNAKTTNYSCTYGAFPPKIAKTAGMPLKEAQKLWETYWERNWSIRKIAEVTQIKEVEDEMWLYNPVSKLFYSLRHKKDIFSTLNQGTGSYCFDVWLGFVLKAGAYKNYVAQFHDEFVLEVDKKEEEKYESIVRQAINTTNDFLKLNRDLDCGVQFGHHYGEIH